MTGVDVAAIRARADAATRAPWKVRYTHSYELHAPDVLLLLGVLYGHTGANAEFIAHARTDVPALLDALAEAERQRDDALAKIARIREVRSCLGAGPMDYEAFTDEVDAALDTGPRPPASTPAAEPPPPRVPGTGGPQNPTQGRGSAG